MLAVLGVATPVAIPVAVTIVLATWVYNVVAVTYVHACSMQLDRLMS